MRDRLIEIIKSSLMKHIDKSCKLAENITDDLLSVGIILPPCKVGDKAYHLTDPESLAEIFEGKVCSISKEEKSLWIYARYDNGLNFWYTEREFGRNLFFTREDAEKALAERRENDNS